MTDESKNDDLGLERLSELAFAGAPPRAHRPWLRVMILALATALAAFAAIGPARVPARLVNLFTDRPVTEVTMQGGSWIEVKLADRADRDQTEAVAAVFRHRGAAIAFSGVGRLILEVPDLYSEDARAWAESISGSGTFELALVEGELPFDFNPGPEDTRIYTGRTGYYRLGSKQIDSADIEGAAVEINPESRRPEVLVSFTAEGAKKLAALTRDNLDRKLAIAVSGEVVVAPVIKSAIEGGRLAITVDGDEREMLSKATMLAAILDSEPLPSAVEIVHVENVYPMEQSSPVLAARAVFAALIGLLAALVVLPLRRRLYLPDPDVSPLRGVDASRRAAWIGLLVSAAGFVAALTPAQLVLPNWGAYGYGHDSWTAIGVTPFLAGAVLALVAGWAVPALRRRRALVAAIVGLAVLALEVKLLGDHFAASGMPRLPSGAAIAGVGAMSVALWGVALAVDRWGIGNGFIVVLAGILVGEKITSAFLISLQSATDLAIYFVGGAAIIAITAYLLRVVKRSRDGAPVRLIGAGAAPLAVVALVNRHLDLQLFGSWPWWAATAALTAVAMALVLRPIRASGPRVVSESVGPRRSMVAAVAVASFAYVAGLMVFGAVAIEPAWALAGPVTLAVGTAGFLDLVAELRARWRNPELVRVARVDDPRAAEVSAGALAAGGIDVHVANRNVRWLLGPAGAWAPLDLWVPAHRRDDAAAIIDGQQ